MRVIETARMRPEKDGIILNTLRAGYCSSINFAGAQTFSGIVTGAQDKGVAGSDELNCVVERGRQVRLRLTRRPFGRNSKTKVEAAR